MTTPVNSRDLIIQGASIRVAAGSYVAIVLRADTQTFHVDTGGNPTPATINLTATLLNATGTVAFSASGATVKNVTPVAGTSDTTATVAFADMTGPTATINASVTLGGKTFTSPLIISKVTDGANGSSGTGTPGARGAGHYYATGNSWSDIVASAACPNSTPVANDVVTISNGTSFVQEKVYNGSNWIAQTPVIDGGLIVNGTVTVNQMNTNGLTVRDTQGNIIFSAGVPLKGANLASNTVGLGHINTTTIPNLASLSATIGTFQSAASGQRVVIKDALVGVVDNTNAYRVKLGDSTLS